MREEVCAVSLSLLMVAGIAFTRTASTQGRAFSFVRKQVCLLIPPDTKE